MCTRNEFNVIAHEEITNLNSELAEADGGCNNTFELGLYEDGRSNDDKVAKIDSSLLERMQHERVTYSTTSHPSNQELIMKARAQAQTRSDHASPSYYFPPWSFICTHSNVCYRLISLKCAVFISILHLITSNQN